MDKIITSAKAGDQQAIELLVSKYKGLIRSVANKFYLVGGDKDDLLQEGMLGLFYAITNYDEQKGSFPSFAKLCVMRQIVDAVKRDGQFCNKPLYNYVQLDETELVDQTDSPLESFINNEHADKVRKFIEDNLTSTERIVLHLFSEGYTYENIVDITNKSYKAVDGALQRARKKLLAFEE